MSTPSQVPVSRRERPAKAPLTREGIVATAVRILRAEGLERVTMRRLAAEMDTGAASLYVYVRNAAELHAAVLDELLGSVDLTPVTAPGPWSDRLLEILDSYTRVLFEHPSLARSALLMWPSGPNYLNVIESLLVLLAEGQVPDDRAAWAVDLLSLYVTAIAAEQGTRERAGGARAEANALTAAICNVSATAFPRIAALGVELLSGNGGDRLSWGFSVLINGVLGTPRPENGRAAGDDHVANP